MSTLHILWDASHIWGVLAVKAAQAMNIPYTLVHGKAIADGILEKESPAMLLIPGGSARQKAASLGPAGIAAVRQYISDGGHYLGFCGGAGFALSGKESLGLCPWRRAGYTDRLQHFMSGHLRMALPSLADNRNSHLIPPHIPHTPSLPVWWPGRFNTDDQHQDVTILATYLSPDTDFWLADLPINDLPPDTFTVWNDVYGLSISPTFLHNQACIVHGSYGKGSYTLSYSHLETPVSPDANLWLAHIFSTIGGFSPTGTVVPALNFTTQQSQWTDPKIHTVTSLIRDILETGQNQLLLFKRNDWLMGWRTGIPGANLNNLWATLQSVQATPPTPAAEQFWLKHREHILNATVFFHRGCIHYLLAERLALTLAKPLPDALPASLLKQQSAALFGAPMQAGGAFKEIMETLDVLAFLQLNSTSQ